jgi:thiamine pyrophosphate-dependent acetolactate synthase large subunit-like protein
VNRYECLEVLSRHVGDTLVIHTGGGTAHEWNALRPGPANLDAPVGGVAGVALGLAKALPQCSVIGLDTDGGLLMNLGVLPDIGNLRPPNLTIIAFDNEVYESTGAQPSASSGNTDFAAMARGAGVEKAVTVRTLEEFEKFLVEALKGLACDFIVAKTEIGAKKVPSLDMSGVEMKFEFVRHIEKTTGVKVLTPPEQQIPGHLVKE